MGEIPNSVCLELCRYYSEAMAMLSGAPERLSHAINRRLRWSSIHSATNHIDEFAVYRDLRLLRDLRNRGKFIEAADYAALAICNFVLGRKAEAIRVLDDGVNDRKAGGKGVLYSLTCAKLADNWEQGLGDENWRVILDYFAHELNLDQAPFVFAMHLDRGLKYRGSDLVIQNELTASITVDAKWIVEINVNHFKFRTTWSDFCDRYGASIESLIDPVAIRLQASRPKSTFVRSLGSVFAQETIELLRTVRFAPEDVLKEADAAALSELVELIHCS